jgi:hypothetical protein
MALRSSYKSIAPDSRKNWNANLHRVRTTRLVEYQKRITEIESDVRSLRVARAFEVDLQRFKAHLRMVQEDFRRNYPSGDGPFAEELRVCLT